MKVFGNKGIDNTLREETSSSLVKEGEGKFVNTDMSTALQGAVKDDTVGEVSSMGNGSFGAAKASEEVQSGQSSV